MGRRRQGTIRHVPELVFLKLGGSLITDKNQRYTPRLERLATLAEEIRDALAEVPGLTLVLGHGSGSFGHYAVQEHLTPHISALRKESSVHGDREYWTGYSEVWYRASELNRHLMDALHGAGLAAMAIAPSATVRASAGMIVDWDLASMNAAMAAGLVPVIYGDIVFDGVHGSTVLSTEALMAYLAIRLRPRRILLAGIEAAVWADYPARTERIDRITPSTYAAVAGSLGGSHGTDVTGGMRDKVEQMLNLVRAIPDLRVQILSGEPEGNIRAALVGEAEGTVIASD
jgi:isopentenyl phosphate kinase